MELFLGMTREQLLECVAVTATRGHLRSALLYCCDLRPLHLLGTSPLCVLIADTPTNNAPIYMYMYM